VSGKIKSDKLFLRERFVIETGQTSVLPANEIAFDQIGDDRGRFERRRRRQVTGALGLVKGV
jgi:hypothetical protein